MPAAVVIGGGISGLSSAYFLSENIDPEEILLIEGAGRMGGVIQTSTISQGAIEAGPDSFITRNASAYDLVRQLGLEEALIAPATGSAFIYARSALHPIPKGTVFGAPSDLRKFAGNTLISTRGQLRAALEVLLPRTKVPDDMTVGSFARRRWGNEVAEWLIDPLVGGIHAGSAFDLSLERCAPQYLKASRLSRSVTLGLSGMGSSQAKPALPMFYSLEGGLERLVEALHSRLRDRGVRIVSNSAALGILKHHQGFEITTNEHVFNARGVICAVPSHIGSKLLRNLDGELAKLLGLIDYSSPIMAILAYPEDAFAHELEGSGVLVPRPTRMLTTAVTFASNKWPASKPPGEHILRVSAGRYRDERAWRLGDEDLINSLHTEISVILGAATSPIRSEIHRWPKSLPQFKPFHGALVDKIMNNLPKGFALAGSPFLGVGIPACISSGSDAARKLAQDL